MTDEWKPIAEEGFRFFGGVSASISHELKNALAIIKENAGLIGDLIAFSLQGRPLDPERLDTIAERLIRQVQRADTILKNLNRFAHGADELQGRVDLRDSVTLMSDLSMRMAFQREVNLQFRVPESPLLVYTLPFLMQNLIWRCLDFAMSEAAGKTKTVIVIAEEKEGDPSVRFTELVGLRKSQSVSFPGEIEEALAKLLRAGIVLNRENAEVVLRFPRSLEEKTTPGLELR